MLVMSSALCDESYFKSVALDRKQTTSSSSTGISICTTAKCLPHKTNRLPSYSCSFSSPLLHSQPHHLLANYFLQPKTFFFNQDLCVSDLISLATRLYLSKGAHHAFEPHAFQHDHTLCKISNRSPAHLVMDVLPSCELCCYGLLRIA